MAILRICAADECNTKTLGVYCIQHESVPRLEVVRREVVRGEVVRGEVRPLAGAGQAA